jgi:hypothetical protein
MAMASKWTNTVPSVPGNYWISSVYQGKIADPRVKHFSQSDLDQLKDIPPGLLMFGDNKIPEPLWEKI